MLYSWLKTLSTGMGGIKAIMPATIMQAWNSMQILS